MTATQYAPSATSGESADTAGQSRLPWASFASAVIGVILILTAYHISTWSNPGYLYYHVFWLGFFLLIGPVGYFLIRGVPSGWRQTSALAAAGVAAYVPHFLRAPTRPFMNDELAHFLQAQNMYTTGKLFLPNPIVTQAPNFPGLETLTVGLRAFTGLGTYQVGCIFLALAHAATVLAVFQLARTVVPERAAAIAGLAYAIGPQFGLVDSLYSYESFGLPLAAGAIAAGAVAARETQRSRRWAQLGLAALLITACIFTHHLSSYAMLLALALVALGWVLWPAVGVSRRAAVPLVGLVVVGSLGAAAWSWARHAHTFSYLSVYVKNGYESLIGQVGGGGSTKTAYNGYAAVTASRTPLSGADKPFYELGATYLAQLVLFALVVYALWRARPRRGATTLLALAFSALYFISLPLLLTAGGQNAAHRSWAFTFIGLAVLVGAGLDAMVAPRHANTGVTAGNARTSTDDHEASAQADRPSWRPKLRRRLASPVAGVVAVLICLVGSHGAGVNTLVAFPGKFVFQSDGRNVPAELYDLADWMRATQGTGNVVLADYRTSVILATIGDEKPFTSLAAELILPPGDPTPDVVAQVRKQAQYIVIDKRLHTMVSSEGYYFWQYETAVAQPLPRASLSKLARYPWLTLIRTTTNYLVYKVAP